MSRASAGNILRQMAAQGQITIEYGALLIRDPEALAAAIVHLHQHPTLARDMGLLGRRRVEQEFSIEERLLHKDELRLFDEVFLTSSVKEVVPIVAVDAIRIGDGRPGRRTRRVMDLFRADTDAYRG